MLAMLMAAAALTGAPAPIASAPPPDGCYLVDVDCGGGTGATGTSSISLDAALGRCQTRWARATRQNGLFMTVFSYYEQVRWCWNGTKVTYLRRDRWPADTHAGWSFDGNIGGSCANEYCTGLIGAYSENAWTQGKFHACLGALGINYCSYKYPRVGITVNANGSSSATWTGA